MNMFRLVVPDRVPMLDKIRLVNGEHLLDQKFIASFSRVSFQHHVPGDTQEC